VQNIGFDLHGFGANYLTKVWMLQRTFNWQLVMSHNISGMVGYLVSQYCQDVKFGDYNIATVSTLRYGSEQRFYAELQSIDAVDLTFLMPADGSVLTYFYGWYELMIDKEGYYYPKNHYKKDIYVILYGRTGIQTIKFRLKGAFPKKRPTYQLAYSEEDVLKVRIELSVDNIEVSKGLLSTIIDKVF